MSKQIVAIRQTMLTVFLGSAALLAQQTPPTPGFSPRIEFPVIMRQKVDAGKTPVGTKVQAQLVVATMVNNVVVPRDAILFGEVTESAAKSKTDPSRLAIRMDSAQWKNGSAPIHAYLIAWFYPVAAMTPRDLSYEPPDAARSNKNWNGMGTYPDPNNPISQQRFPGRDTDKGTSPAPPTPASSISQHRVVMKDVESTRNSDGAVTLTSKHSNIRLDKTTTYVLASGDLLAKD